MNWLAQKNLTRWLPFLSWFPMSGVQVRADLMAGLTVALVLIPQSMAYAQLAGLPSYYGLYAAFLPVLVGALWGSSKQLSTGPVAIVALLTASALAPLAVTGSDQYIALAILLAIMVGAIQLALGLFRLGAIVNLLSHPVIIGFTNAAAIIIGLSQLNKLLGVPMSRSESFLNDIYGVLLQVGEAHWPTLVMGLGALALMLLMKRFLPRWPNVLVAVALATLLSWQLGFEQRLSVRPEALRDPVAQGLVADYRAGQQRIAGLEADLASAREALRDAQAVQDADLSRRALQAELEYRVELGQVHLDEALKEKQARLKSLTQLRFVAVTEADGSTGLYGESGAPAQSDQSVVWRVKKLDDQWLYLSGGGEVVGAIPPGLPSLSMPKVGWSDFTALLSAALVIALVAFMEAISIAKAMAAKTRARIDPNQELVGQGLANLVGAASQSFPVSGSFSRSAVNLNAGAVTGLSSVFTGVLVLLTLLFLTSLLYHLPQAVLAAVIMLAVVGLINLGAMRHAWHTHRHDGLAATVTFVATLAFAPHLDMGILIGAVVAIALFLHRRMRPRGEILGQHPDGVLGGLDTHGLTPISQVVVPVRFDGELTFVNVSYFEDMMLEAVQRFPEAKAILLIGSSINEIDVSGEEKLSDLARRLEQGGVKLYLSGLKKQVLEVLERAEIHKTLPPERIFRSKDQALKTLLDQYG
jgi:SulP family sulfate permease